MAKGQKDRPVLYRAVKFELHLTLEQEKLLQRISDGLREIWNWALDLRVKAYEEYKKQKTSEMQKPEVRLPTLFDQINLLTNLRGEDERKGLSRARTPRNWQEETLDTLDSAFKSFFALAKKGDKDARPPWVRKEQYFCEIPGRFLAKAGRQARPLKNKRLHLARNTFGEVLDFPVPAYCQAKLEAGKGVKKFTIFRDEPLLSKPGRYWISLVYEIDKPEPLAFESAKAVWLAVGATWLGVLSPNGEEVVKLWRPDTHWKPKIDVLEQRIKTCKKGSRVWHKRTAARREMFRLMSAQQKQDHREVVKWLLKFGVYFVVQDLPIRGALADASRPNRSDLNWAVQNTGSIGELLRHLDEKAKEYGGCVIKHEPSSQPPPGRGEQNKLPMAKRLKEDFLQSKGLTA